jgi:4-oxalocrotonate tautomerase|uniref:4-oxalocrotonate tautomerase n=1 Tax=Mesoaciditoga lauensis TaxID=1495039 RepID=A0A7V3VSZ4_9BACT
MPYISIEAGKMTKEQKRALITEFTKSASEILKIPEAAFMVMIKENDPDNIGTGGKVLSETMKERK